MQKNINEEAQKKRRKDAVWSAAISTVYLLVSATIILVLRWYYQIDNFFGAILFILALLELGMIIPIWILLKTRLKEIEGGEEDAATQY